jgi:tRNA threonylcarbamoyladenosine biosynthesis protein TsaB
VLILALDSATSRCSLALWRDGSVLSARSAPDPRRSDDLPLLAQAAMAEAGAGFPAIDRLAVTIGPGRFTGLRAGLAFMRGLALAIDRPLLGITTLDALQAPRRCVAGETALATIGSGRAEAFFQIGTGAPFARRPADLAGLLPPAAPVAVVGEEVAGVVAALAAIGIAARGVPCGVDAAEVAALAATRLPDASPPGPLYIHPPAVTAPRPRRAVP